MSSGSVSSIYKYKSPEMQTMNRPLFFFASLCLSLSATTPLFAQKISTVVGTGEPKLNRMVGIVEGFNLGDPFGVEFGPDGCLYVCEVRNHRILKVDLGSGEVVTVAGTGKKGYSGDGGPAVRAEMNEPYEIRFAKNGDLYFVEMMNHIVRKIDARTKTISTVAGTGKAGFFGDGGSAIKAKLNRPHSIALDGDGGLFIADIGNHRIRKVDLKTGLIDSFAGSEEKGLPVDGGKVNGEPVLGPRALFIQEGAVEKGEAVLWVALREGNSVWKIDLNSPVWQHVAGTGKKGYSGDGNDAILATFNGPKGIAVENNQCFVVDTENQAIRKIDLKTGIVTTIAGNGQKGGKGDGGIATLATLGRPHGVCVKNGKVFIGDTLNHRVRSVATGEK